MAAYRPDKVGEFNGTDDLPSTNGNWAPATAPVNDDNAVIRGHSKNIASGGDDMSAVELDVLHFTPTYLGSVGTLSNVWHIDSTDVYFESGGPECWLDGTFGAVYVNSDQRGTNALQLNTVNANTITDLILMRGRATVGDGGGSGGVVTTAVVAANRPTEGILVVAGATMSTVIVDMGKVEWQSNAGTPTVNLNAGEVVQTGGTITVMNVYGGRFTPKQGAATTINIYGAAALLDLTQVEADLAITTINLFRGAYLRPATLQLLANSITVNYRTVGEHKHNWGETDTWG